MESTTNNNRPPRVVDYLVAAIATLGVRHVFGVDGANIEDVYDALFDAGLADPDSPVGVVAKHEFAAATMADGYARSTSGIGVVVATSGGGAMNLVAGLAESFASRVPVLALVGQPPTTLEGQGAFQDTSGRAGTFDLEQTLATMTRYCARVHRPGDIAEHLARAVAAAQRGGPAVLLLPKDVQQAEYRPSAPFRAAKAAHLHDLHGVGLVRDTLAAGHRAGKVVIIAGDQVARDDARSELRQLAAALDASVGVAPDAKDVYGQHEPGYRGVAGIMGHPDLHEALRHAAVCLLVGTRMPVTTRGGLDELLAGTVVTSIGAEPPHIRSTHAVSTDLAADLAELSAALADGSSREPARPPSAPEVLAVPTASGPGLRYRDAVEAIAATLPPEADVFADAGNTGAAVVHHLPVPPGGRFVVALGMGGMGYAFGAGIGSAFARSAGTGRRTYVIAGDGAFYMHGMEIHTAIEHDLPITFVVFNNNAHAMCVTREQLFYRDRYSFNRFRPTHIGEGIAAMFPDLPACTAGTRGELDRALRAAAESRGPTFIEVDCDPDEMPPFAPFLAVRNAG
ncbi:thiamine pyrophosphate-binding protein [Aldersonia sp. NBC_00410]|uniref:thiamine pyrophosphate-binding protein n=1 Tax=Aldersonia sp. NBC_00410 TaxID=2975954 RepID=UPI0022576EED|nr:thiamine pyrophosphate-binding protein [Aldersonia sp. NBC_00410]MCX5044983.1 thiamine pyrophosphate-binding protein [Aldersonia sp. NBC_00410]